MKDLIEFSFRLKEKHFLQNESNALKRKYCKKTHLQSSSKMKFLTFTLNDFCKKHYQIPKCLHGTERSDQNILQIISQEPRYDQDQIHAYHYKICICMIPISFLLIQIVFFLNISSMNSFYNFQLKQLDSHLILFLGNHRYSRLASLL